MKIGFAVIYRWRLIAGKEDQFQQSWAHVTKLLLAHRGALGSRLHQTDDGLWLAYAQWPDRETWQNSRDAGSIDEQAMQSMMDAVAEGFDPILLNPTANYLECTSPDP